MANTMKSINQYYHGYIIIFFIYDFQIIIILIFILIIPLLLILKKIKVKINNITFIVIYNFIWYFN